MKLTVLFVLVGMFNVHAKGVSQTITLSGKNLSLSTVFAEVERQTGYLVVGNYEILDNAKPVTVNVKDKNVVAFIDLILQNQPLTFSIENKTIFIKEKSELKVGDLNHRLSHVLYPPPITVRGRIVDEKGEPVMASVAIKGTKRGVTTDAEGNFEIVSVDDKAILVISATNIETLTTPVNKSEYLNIVVKTTSSSLEGVVINKGYYAEIKKISTGNTSRLSSKEIEMQPVSNILSAAIGRMPGVFVQQGSGLAGGGMNIEIRGRNSVRPDGNAPLYLIDGIPFPSSPLSQGITEVIPSNPLNSISSNDIENIEILKDADATAIYGSRGANGVILITTKKGKSGKTRFEFNIASGRGNAIYDKVKLLSTPQYISMRREAIANDGYTALLDDPSYNNLWPDLKVWDTTRFTDWRKVLIGGTTSTTNAQAAVSGGNAQTQFLFSTNFYRETTVFPGNFSFKRGSGHLNVNHTNENGKFTMNLATTYTIADNNLPTADLTSLAFTLAPNAPALYTENGKLNWELYNGTSTWDNPFSFLGKTFSSKSTNLNTNLSVGYEITSQLKLKTNLGYNIIQFDELQQNRLSYQNPTAASSMTSVGVGGNSVKTWIAEPQLEYHQNLFKGNLTALIGLTLNESIQEGQRMEATGFSTESLINNINAAANIDILSVNYAKYRYNAGFARINYNWKEKYIINFTGRRDGSSRFGPDKRFANFGAIGAAWIFSKGKFMENSSSFLSFGKLRFSYGTTGSDQIGDYRYLDTYDPGFRSYGVGALQPVRLPNADYGWEENNKMETGLDLGFNNDRIYLSISYFRNRSSNQLIGLPLPIMTGFNEVQFNLPATIQNTGLELQLNTTNLRTADWLWSSSFNITAPRSKTVSFPFLNDLADYRLRFVEGKPITTAQRYGLTALDPATGNYQFTDFNEDGIIDLMNDRKVLLDLGVKYYGGLNNTIRYKGFQADIFIQFTKQSGRVFETSFGMPGINSNQPAKVLDRWQKPGDETMFRKFNAFTSSTNYALWQSSNMSITDASYLRIKNISLSWKIPGRWLQEIKFQDSRIYFQGQNLITFTPFNGTDPETGGISTLPPLRTLVVGLQFSF